MKKFIGFSVADNPDKSVYIDRDSIVAFLDSGMPASDGSDACVIFFSVGGESKTADVKGNTRDLIVFISQS